ncbi:MAG: TetR/AcrR family transcriptional regulator [Proteobacteria bacterium]|nr:TetR/AcrR family transcriptional regulator [Pseudomonadota bacterium]
MPRAADTRAKILEVAEAEFAAEGYAGAHLQKIAEQVGVRKTALYYYFDSKAALYGAVLESILEDLDRVVAAALETSETPEHQLEELVTRFNAMLAEKPNCARILLRVFVDRPPGLTATLLPTLTRVIGRVMSCHRRGVDAGTFHRISTRHFFLSSFGLMLFPFGLMLFHYAAPAFSAAVLGIEDVFTGPVVAWRRDEVLSLLRDGVLARPDEAKS